MGIGGIITRAIIGGAIKLAVEAAREKARADAELSQQANSKVTADAASASIEVSFRKAFRVIGIIDGVLEQTRDEWLPVSRAYFSEYAVEAEQIQPNINNSINQLHAHLKSKGFPCDTDPYFWTTVSDIHFELILYKIFPRAWEEWDENMDGVLERAVGEAKRMLAERRVEMLHKLMPQGLPPSDPREFGERLRHATDELLAEVILPELIRAGLVLNNYLFSARFGRLVSKLLISDLIEFSGELTHS